MSSKPRETKLDRIRKKIKALDDGKNGFNVIASGEVVASPAIFQSHTWLAASKGAPVEWLPMDLVPNNVGSAAIALKPPIPTARFLWPIFS